MNEDDGYREIPYSMLPQGKLRTLAIQTADAIEHFSVGIVFDDELRGSGTLIDAFGSLGVLTAYHVVEETLESGPGDLCLIIDTRPHRFELDRRCIEHFPLGIPEGASYADGPDLSFLKLSGEPKLSALKAKKSFYRIAGKSFDKYRSLPLENVPWFLTGAPAELSRPMTSKTDEGALFAKLLVAEAAFKSLENKCGHEILRLSLIAGSAPFPENYKGVSGGGIWIAPLTAERGKVNSTIGIDPCHLAGVAYYQGGLDGEARDILGNGPKTLESLLHTLKV